jgi:hypothetical protein
MSPHGKPRVVWCTGRCFRLFLTLERKNNEQERLHLGSRPKSFGWLGTGSRSFNGRDRPMGLDRRHFCSHGLALREIIRTKEPIYESLDLGNPKWDDDALIDCLLANPILINRPIVLTPRGTRLCRPAELVLELLA